MEGTFPTSHCCHIQFLDKVLSELCIDLWFIFSNVGPKLWGFQTAFPVLLFHPSQKRRHSVRYFLRTVLDWLALQNGQDSWTSHGSSVGFPSSSFPVHYIERKREREGWRGREGESRGEEKNNIFSKKELLSQWLLLTPRSVTMKTITC